MSTNDFLPFGDDPSARVLDQTDYAAAPWRPLGFDSGIAVKENLNKVWRQSSVMVAAIAAIMAARTGDNVLDDGNLSNLETTFVRAITAIAGGVAPTYAVDTGSTNALVITPDPAFSSLATGQPFLIKVAHANTGATTLAVNGITAKNVLDQNGAALAAGALTVGAMILVTYDGTAFQWVAAPPAQSFIHALPALTPMAGTEEMVVWSTALGTLRKVAFADVAAAVALDQWVEAYFMGMF